MSFATTISALSSKVDGLIANRVAKFAYTQQAYNSDDVNGVENYDYAEEQNIPLGTASVLKVNETILTKGWRTQASAITRMLMNHFLGRTSYNLNKTVDFLKSLMTAITDNMGVAEGFATLDANGRIPSGQLTEEVMEYKGEWNADTNTPELDEETGKKGDVYKVSVSGTQDLGEGEKYFRVDTYIIFNGTAYTVLSGEDVAKVNNIAPDSFGNVTLTGEDIATSSADSMSLADKIKLNLKRSFGYLLGRYFEAFTLPFSFNFETGDTLFYYLNGKYFATDNSFGIKVSTDFKTWKNTNVLADKYTIHCINNIFIAVYAGVNYGAIKISNDGLNWEDTEITGVHNFSSCIKDNTGFFNVYSYDTELQANVYYLYKTVNGRTWTLIDTGATARYTGLFYKGKFFAFHNGYFCVSSDGETWLTTDMPKNLLAGSKSLTYNGSMWVACFTGKGICYSTDSLHWIQSSVSDDDYAFIIFANGVFVASGASTDSAVKYSTDGITWINTNITSNAPGSTYYYNGIWLKNVGADISSAGGALKYSLNGTYWNNTSLTSGVDNFYYFNGVFIAYSKTNGMYISTDGITWVNTQRADRFNSLKVRLLLATKDLFAYAITRTTSTVYISSLDILEEKGWLNLD